MNKIIPFPYHKIKKKPVKQPAKNVCALTERIKQSKDFFKVAK